MTALLALLASAFWGTADFGGGIVSRRMPVVLVMLTSQVVALVLLTAGLCLPGVHVHIGVYLVYGALAGFLNLFGVFAFYRAMTSGPMSLVAPIAACGTALPVAYGLLRGEHVSVVQGAGIAVAFVGIVLVSGPEFRSGFAGGRTILLALGAAAGFGSLYLFSGLGAPHGVYGTLLAEKLTGIVILLPFVIATGTLKGMEFKRSTVGLAVVVGLGDIGASASYDSAAHSGHLAMVSVLGSLYPVVTSLLARQVLHERLRTVQNIGVLAALGGVVLINV
ncbi:DMT family transporter [Streptomyces sp. SL13]|uniref:DMT family transporter n=1 Tax=Streptantibioticus silvisoli TaxID=2705255 RepID=A0AA90K9Z1_9ACTN|nr:DMT family transporter [Streptantibioticus silvisoli]MDI5964162.1 DMT family transporter [Streptantibioticus silvisoli]MDI5971773.1 DMT family transporter [Streptantibioticus silvisoli]